MVNLCIHLISTKSRSGSLLLDQSDQPDLLELLVAKNSIVNYRVGFSGSFGNRNRFSSFPRVCSFVKPDSPIETC